MNRNDFFVTGGALLADAGSYVARAADDDLVTALRAGEFCYVLTTRQMGKTSLTVRTAAQLREEGRAVVVLDLTAYGQNLDVEQWYFSMLSDVAGKLHLEDEMEAYWEANLRRAPLHRLIGAIREVYLEKRRKPLTIFVDEIDVVRSLRQFRADEFFAGIRECYNRRSEDPRLQRLAFCLLGVATPSDLISDQQMTPFNIGRGIELADFTRSEAAVLAAGLSPYRETALDLLDRVLSWTGGHPYLTQRLCAEVAKATVQSPGAVDDICTGVFLSADASSRDENLQFVRERLLRSELGSAALLDAYARVLRGERLAFDDHNPIHNELRLSGIVRSVDGNLQPRNRIYSRVFNMKWVRANLPEPEEQRQRAAFWRGVRRVAGAAALAVVVIGGLALQAKRSAAMAQAATEKIQRAAQGEREALERERLTAERERKSAAEARANAEAAQLAAERERKANEDRLAQAVQTELAYKRLGGLQKEVATLLETLTPSIGHKAGRSILDRVDQLVAGLAGETRDDSETRIREADLRRICGRIYLRLGNEERALEQAEAARQLVRTELERDSSGAKAAAHDVGELKKLLHESHLLVGDVLLGGKVPQVAARKPATNYEKAMKEFGAAAELARTESAAHPADAKWRQLYFSDLLNLADTAAMCSQTEEAKKRLTDAIGTIKAMRAKQPTAPDLGWTEATFRDRLGTLHLHGNEDEKARKEFDTALQLREAGATDGAPEDPERLSDMAQSFNKLGNVSMNASDWKAALTYHQRSLDIRRKLCEQNPRLDWSRNLGFSLYNVAWTLWKSGMSQLAAAHFEERLRLAEDLFARDQTDANLRSDYGKALFGYADILLNAKDPTVQNWPKALEMARLAVARTDRHDPRLLALLAQALRLNNSIEEATTALDEAEKLLPPEDKRTAEDRETAKEIKYERDRARSPAGIPKKIVPKKPPSKRR